MLQIQSLMFYSRCSLHLTPSIELVNEGVGQLGSQSIVATIRPKHAVFKHDLKRYQSDGLRHQVRGAMFGLLLDNM